VEVAAFALIALDFAFFVIRCPLSVGRVRDLHRAVQVDFGIFRVEGFE
jgi:hypothetical protein